MKWGGSEDLLKLAVKSNFYHCISTAGNSGVRSYSFANSTLLHRVPISDIHTFISVPGASHCGGFIPAPIPEQESARFPTVGDREGRK